MIFDTDVLIWFFRGNESARQSILEHSPFSISAISHMEMMQGAKDKADLTQMKKFLNRTKTSVIPVTAEITYLAMDYVERYALSHSMKLADALIAATCVKKRETLCTANEKHYRHITELDLRTFRP